MAWIRGFGGAALRYTFGGSGNEKSSRDAVDVTFTRLPDHLNGILVLCCSKALGTGMFQERVSMGV